LRSLRRTEPPPQERQDVVHSGRAGCRRYYLFQEPRLLPWLTVDGNLDFALASCRVPASRWGELKSHYLAMTRLSDYWDYYPHQISGGMAQRLALVRALCVEPGILPPRKSKIPGRF
jgi:NitT/TauT family transport system ATP-binding protein